MPVAKRTAAEQTAKRVVIPVKIEALEEGGFLATCDAIQGCHAQANTVGEALYILEDVARVLLEVQKEDGLPTPGNLPRYDAKTLIEAQLLVTLPE